MLLGHIPSDIQKSSIKLYDEYRKIKWQRSKIILEELTKILYIGIGGFMIGLQSQYISVHVDFFDGFTGTQESNLHRLAR